MRRVGDVFRRVFGGFPRSLWFVLVGMFIDRVGWFVMPFFAIYLTDARHLSDTDAGLAVSLIGGGLAAGGAIGGVVADRVGRRSAMLLGLVGGAGMLIVLGNASSFVSIGCCAALYGTILGTYAPGAEAFVADVVPANDRARAYGLLYWASNAGSAIGTALAGLLAAYGFQWLFIGDAGTTLVYAAIVFVLVTETRPEEVEQATGGSFADVLGDKVYLAFLLLVFTFWFIFHQALVTLALDMRAHGLSPAAYGGSIALNGIAIVALQPVVTPWLARFRPERVLATATIVTGAGFALYALSSSAFVYPLGVVIWTLGEIAFAPLASAFVAELAPLELRGRYQGAYSFAVQASVLVGPLVGGAVLGRAGSRVLWLGLLGLSIVAAAGHLAIAPAHRRRLAMIRAQ